MYSYRKKTLWEQFKLWSKPRIKRLGIWLIIVGICVIADRIWLLYQTWEDDTRLATKIIIAETLGSMAEWGGCLLETIVMAGGVYIGLYICIIAGLYFCSLRKEQREKKEWLNKAQDEVNQYVQEAFQKAQSQLEICAAEYLGKLRELTAKQRLYVDQAITKFRAMHAGQHFQPAYQVISAEQEASCHAAAEALDQDPEAPFREETKPKRGSDQVQGQSVAARPTLTGNIITNRDERDQEPGLIEVWRDSEDAGDEQPSESVTLPFDDPPWFMKMEQTEIPLEIRNQIRALAEKPPLTELPEKKESKSSPVVQEVTAVEEIGEPDVPCDSEGMEDSYVSVESPYQRESTANLVEQVSSGNPKDDGREKAGSASDGPVGYERGARNNNPLITAIIRFMENRDLWKGSPSELWDALENLVDDRSKESQEWPKSPVWIIRKINDIDQELLQAKLDWATGRSNQGRWCMISQNEKV